MPEDRSPVPTVIMGAAGRDFHNFNMIYRDDPATRVVAFTATQIPDIEGRMYPPALAGPLYPDGIPILSEDEFAFICREHAVARAVFAYSDVSHEYVMHRASVALAAGADFQLLAPTRTMIDAACPVIATSAVRTGCGKSPVTRWLAARLKARGLRIAAIRHPMPYGDLVRQAVQRFATIDDIDAAGCTVEEREEYEPHVAMGTVIYAGVDYARIVAEAERDADVILWDGGNNDFPFLRPDLHIVLTDPLRPGHEATHFPGEAVLRMADVAVITKVNSASSADVQQVAENIARIAPDAEIVRGASPVRADDPDALRGKRVLVVEDGPTVTHGGMAYGAGYVAATEAHAVAIVDPRRAAAQPIAEVYRRYPHIGAVLPAMGYSAAQLRALSETINASDADVVAAATPCDLSRLIEVNKPVVRVRYEFAEAGGPSLGDAVDRFIGARLNPTR